MIMWNIYMWNASWLFAIYSHELWPTRSLFFTHSQRIESIARGVYLNVHYSRSLVPQHGKAAPRKRILLAKRASNNDVFAINYCIIQRCFPEACANVLVSMRFTTGVLQSPGRSKKDGQERTLQVHSGSFRVQDWSMSNFLNSEKAGQQISISKNILHGITHPFASTIVGLCPRAQLAPQSWLEGNTSRS